MKTCWKSDCSGRYLARWRAGLILLGVICGSDFRVEAQVSVSGNVWPGPVTVPVWEPGDLQVGSSEEGTLMIQEGGTVLVRTTIKVGYNPTGDGAIIMNGGSLSTTMAGLYIGEYGKGSLSMRNDASVSLSWGNLSVGGYGYDPSSVTMDASSLGVSHGVSLLGAGNSTIDLTNKSTLTAGGLGVFNGWSGAEAKVTVDDSTLELQGLRVGTNGWGTLIVKNGGIVSVGTGLDIAYNSTGRGRVEVRSGTLTLGNNYNLNVGRAGSGELEISSGGRVDAWNVSIEGFGTSYLLLDGGRLNVTKELRISNPGNGSTGGMAHFTIRNGGVATSETGWVGGLLLRPPGQQEYAEIFSGSWSMTGKLSVSTMLRIHEGGTVTNQDSEIAFASGGGRFAQVIVDGGTWTNTGTLSIGGQPADSYANGAMTVSNGGTVTSKAGRLAVGNASTAAVLVNGGTWSNSGSLSVGERGHGTLTVTNGGEMVVGDGEGILTLGTENSGNGFLNIGDYDRTGTAGALRAAEIRGGNGAAHVSFNQTDEAVIDAAITGRTSVTQRGSGTTTLTQANSYTGVTRVLEGTLRLASNATLEGTSRIEISSTGRLEVGENVFHLAENQALAGGGVIVGKVNLEGTLAPGFSPGLMTFEGDLALSSSSRVFMELGGTARGVDYDALDITGDMSFSGILTISLLDGFTPATSQVFRLFDVGGITSGEFAGITFSEEGYSGAFDAATGLLTITGSPIPEPSGLGLAGAAAILLLRRRRGACGRAG